MHGSIFLEAPEQKMDSSKFTFEIRKAEQRGVADFGWLRSCHTFSFGQYSDPHQMGFSDLLVINDDTVAPGGGFGAHPHADMEIFTYVLDGALEHKDSLGTGSVIHPGDVQAMSAGTGVRHSEFNHSKEEPVHFLQIWIVPDKNGIAPRYQQTHFSENEKRGKLRVILSSTGADGSLKVQQDVAVFAGLFDGKESFTKTIEPGRYAYIHIARGVLTVNGHSLKAGDGVRIRTDGELKFSNGTNAEVLVFDLRGQELPDIRKN
jgi:redox-sensitive bicupin YhaK (pirin superfamily)